MSQSAQDKTLSSLWVCVLKRDITLSDRDLNVDLVQKQKTGKKQIILYRFTSLLIKEVKFMLM